MKDVINEITCSLLLGKSRSLTQIDIIIKLKITRELLGLIVQLYAHWSIVTCLSWRKAMNKSKCDPSLLQGGYSQQR